MLQKLTSSRDFSCKDATRLRKSSNSFFSSICCFFSASNLALSMMSRKSTSSSSKPLIKFSAIFDSNIIVSEVSDVQSIAMCVRCFNGFNHTHSTCALPQIPVLSCPFALSDDRTAISRRTALLDVL